MYRYPCGTSVYAALTRDPLYYTWTCKTRPRYCLKGVQLVLSWREIGRGSHGGTVQAHMLVAPDTVAVSPTSAPHGR